MALFSLGGNRQDICRLWESADDGQSESLSIPRLGRPSKKETNRFIVYT